MTAPRPAAPTPDAHKRIAGYEILSKLGQGGMGAVYKARQVSLDRMVALKVLPKQLTDKHDFVGRFSREARITGQLNHANIIKVYDVGQSSTGIWYYAMEFVEGESLRAVLEREGKVPPKRMARILGEMASALDHAHKFGIVHRDIKPDNILIGKDGASKLADLGLAKHAEGASLGREASFASMAGTVVGTPYYMAPEQVEGKAVDIRSDLYALGATAYHLLAGKPPFDADSAMGVLTKHVTEALLPLAVAAPDTPPGLARIVERMMEKDPARRYQTPAEALADLASIRGELNGTARTRPAGKRGWGKFAAAALLLFGAGGGVLVYAQVREKRALRDASRPPLPVPPAPAEDPRRREEAAQEALRAALAFQAAHPGDRSGLAGLLSALERDHPGTRAAGDAALQRRELEARLLAEGRERERLEAVEKTVRALIAGGHLEAARSQLASVERTEASAPLIAVLEEDLRKASLPASVLPPKDRTAETLDAVEAKLRQEGLDGVELGKLEKVLSSLSPDGVLGARRGALLDDCRARREALEKDRLARIESRARAKEAFSGLLPLAEARDWKALLPAARDFPADLLPLLEAEKRARVESLRDLAARNLDHGWRCDFEDRSLKGWEVGAPHLLVPHSGGGGMGKPLAPPEDRKKPRATLALVEAPPKGKPKTWPERAIEGKTSLRIGSKALGGKGMDANGEARGPKLTILPGAVLRLKYRICLADPDPDSPGGNDPGPGGGFGPGPGGGGKKGPPPKGNPGNALQAVYVCLRDPAGDLLSYRPSGAQGMDLFSQDILTGKDLGMDPRVWGPTASPSAEDGVVEVRLDDETLFRGRKSLEARLCAGFTLADAEDRTAQLIIDSIEVFYEEERP